uniref:Uncharacterized protein n=1 Tax=Avena sativa TaxID=4498 RepID=A0ACD5XB40_AVESA
MAKARAADAAGVLLDELLLEIFARVPDVLDLIRCAGTCTRWFRLICCPEFLRRIGLSTTAENARQHKSFLIGAFYHGEAVLVSASEPMARICQRPPRFFGLRKQPATFTSFIPNNDGTFNYAHPLLSRRGLLLMRTMPTPLDRGELHLAVCHPLIGEGATRLVPPPPLRVNTGDVREPMFELWEMPSGSGLRAATGTPPRDRRRSETPPRQRQLSRGRSRARRGGNEIIVHERTIQERPVQSGVLVWPMLTATNYIEWALLVQINMEACMLWDAVEGNASSVPNDKAALAAILRAVPPEMVGTLVVKKSAKEAWDAIKVMRVGVDRVREATAQRLRKEFEDIAFRDGEMLDSFAMRITTLVNNLRSLGDTVDEVKVVQKILREVPERYAQMACSIETLLDLSTVSVEDLIGRLRSSEGRFGAAMGANAGSGTLLLTEAEWEAHRKQREQGQDHPRQPAFRVLFTVFCSDDQLVHAYSYSSAANSWSAPFKCSQTLGHIMCGPLAGVVTGEIVHWLYRDSTNFYTLDVCAQATRVSLTKIPIQALGHVLGRQQPPFPCIAGDGKLSFVNRLNNGRLELWTKPEDEQGDDDHNRQDPLRVNDQGGGQGDPNLSFKNGTPVSGHHRPPSIVPLSSSTCLIDSPHSTPSPKAPSAAAPRALDPAAIATRRGTAPPCRQKNPTTPHGRKLPLSPRPLLNFPWSRHDGCHFQQENPEPRHHPRPSQRLHPPLAAIKVLLWPAFLAPPLSLPVPLTQAMARIELSLADDKLETVANP